VASWLTLSDKIQLKGMTNWALSKLIWCGHQ